MTKKTPHPASVRKKQTATVKDVIESMLKSYNIDKKFDERHVIAAWEKIMGKAIANRTTNIEVRNDVMVVSLSSAPLKHELNASRSKVLELITKEFGKPVVKDVLFI